MHKLWNERMSENTNMYKHKVFVMFRKIFPEMRLLPGRDHLYAKQWIISIAAKFKNSADNPQLYTSSECCHCSV